MVKLSESSHKLNIKKQNSHPVIDQMAILMGYYQKSKKTLIN